MDSHKSTNEMYRYDHDSDLGDDSPTALHIDERSDPEDLRDCSKGESSDEGIHVTRTPVAKDRLRMSAMDFSSSPDRHSDTHLNHLAPNHPLGVLGNLTFNMGVSGLQSLQNLQNLQHNDVLEKLKMQVRDMKVGLMESEYMQSQFGVPNPSGAPFTLPQISSSSSRGETPQNLSATSNGYPYSSTNPPVNSKDVAGGSDSSTSSETSNSSQQNNGWSFEEQFKQVRQLYEINDDPKRKEFLDDLFSFMQKRGTPINRLPIMAKSVLDLYELYNLVIARGGLVDVINKKLWQEIIKGLHLPSSITSAAFTLRTQYMKYLYPYECEKKNLSNPTELQAAIDGNRREGRRSSYGQFDSQMQSQMQLSQVQRSPVSSGIQQMSPLSLVTHGGSQAAHHRLMGAPSVGQIPNIVPHDIEQRMMEYIKLFQNPKEPRRSQSPDISPREALNALEMSRVALWSMCNNNISPPTSINTTSPPGATSAVEPPQRYSNNHAFPENHAIKRERDLISGDFDDHHGFVQPPAKRSNVFNTAQMASLAAAHQSNLNEILAAAVSNGNGANLSRRSHNQPEDDDEEEDEIHDDEDEDHHIQVANIRPNPNHHLHSSALSHRLMNNSSRGVDVKRPFQDKLSKFRRKSTSKSEEEEEDLEHEPHNPVSLFGGLQFKITKSGFSESGDPELVVTMEINNVTYEGTLFASSKKNQKSLGKANEKVLPTSLPLTPTTQSPVKSTSSSSSTTAPIMSPVKMTGDSDMMNNNNCLNKNSNLDKANDRDTVADIGREKDRLENRHDRVEDEVDDHVMDDVPINASKGMNLEDLRVTQPMISS